MFEIVNKITIGGTSFCVRTKKASRPHVKDFACARERLRVRTCRIWGVLAFLLFTFAACDDYDSFTTDRSKTLSFSRDTILFDTLFTTIPSSTQTLTVFNHADEGLRITDVWLEGGAASPFRINIDGQDMSRSAENHVTDFEVRRRDSLIVRAEVTLPAWDADEPREVKDALIFALESGIQQRVPLVVVGRDAFFLRARILNNDTVFSARRPVVIADSLVVAEGATLTLEAGTQLYFNDTTALIMHGRLVANGTLADPVVLRCDRTDHMFDYLPYDRLPSRWQGIHLTATSSGNDLNYVDLHGGSYGIICDSTGTDELKLTLTNSRLHNLGGHGLDITDCRVEVANTEISNTLGDCVRLMGGHCRFTHCTMAQFYPLSADRGLAIDISFYEDSVTYHPLHEATFINCVATGYETDVVMIPNLDPRQWGYRGEVEEPVINFSFSHCYLATELPDDELYTSHFTDCVLEERKGDYVHEKNFTLMDTHAFLYDFTPVKQSAIRSAADAAQSTAWPLDRLGRSRTADPAPDAGCYEYIETTSKEN